MRPHSPLHLQLSRQQSGFGDDSLPCPRGGLALRKRGCCWHGCCGLDKAAVAGEGKAERCRSCAKSRRATSAAGDAVASEGRQKDAAKREYCQHQQHVYQRPVAAEGPMCSVASQARRRKRKGWCSYRCQPSAMCGSPRRRLRWPSPSPTSSLPLLHLQSRNRQPVGDPSYSSALAASYHRDLFVVAAASHAPLRGCGGGGGAAGRPLTEAVLPHLRQSKARQSRHRRPRSRHNPHPHLLLCSGVGCGCGCDARTARRPSRAAPTAQKRQPSRGRSAAPVGYQGDGTIRMLGRLLPLREGTAL